MYPTQWQCTGTLIGTLTTETCNVTATSSMATTTEINHIDGVFPVMLHLDFAILFGLISFAIIIFYFKK